MERVRGRNLVLASVVAAFVASAEQAGAQSAIGQLEQLTGQRIDRPSGWSSSSRDALQRVQMGFFSRLLRNVVDDALSPGAARGSGGVLIDGATPRLLRGSQPSRQRVSSSRLDFANAMSANREQQTRALKSTLGSAFGTQPRNSPSPFEVVRPRGTLEAPDGGWSRERESDDAVPMASARTLRWDEIPRPRVTMRSADSLIDIEGRLYDVERRIAWHRGQTFELLGEALQGMSGSVSTALTGANIPDSADSDTLIDRSRTNFETLRQLEARRAEYRRLADRVGDRGESIGPANDPRLVDDDGDFGVHIRDSTAHGKQLDAVRRFIIRL